jgi:hypothetical protein
LKFARICALTAALAGMAVFASTSLAAGGGIATASSSPTGASGAVLDLAGLLTLGKSNTSTTSGPSVQTLTLLNTNLLGKDAANHDTGALAAVGALVQSLDTALCKHGTTGNSFCLAVLSSSDSSKTTASGTASSASYQTLALSLASLHVRLLGSSASSVKTSVAGVPVCQNGAVGYVLSTDPVVPGTQGLNIQNESVTNHC